MSKTQLPDSDSLQELQRYFKRALAERGYADETLSEKIMLLTEELGELARAVRKHTAVKMSNTTSQSNAAEEAADIAILLMDLCGDLGIDLYEAILAKEKINQKRTWQ